MPPRTIPAITARLPSLPPALPLGRPQPIPAVGAGRGAARRAHAQARAAEREEREDGRMRLAPLPVPVPVRWGAAQHSAERTSRRSGPSEPVFGGVLRARWEKETEEQEAGEEEGWMSLMRAAEAFTETTQQVTARPTGRNTDTGGQRRPEIQHAALPSSSEEALDLTSITEPTSHEKYTAPHDLALRKRRDIQRVFRSLLHRRQYRQLVFLITHDPALRSDTELVDKIGRALSRVGAGNSPHARGAAVLALRIGCGPSGARRGPHWERLHRELFVRDGRLPAWESVMRAIREDVNEGQAAVHNPLGRLWAPIRYTQHRGRTRTQEEGTTYLNNLLSRWLAVKRYPATSMHRTPSPARSGHDPPQSSRPASSPRPYSLARASPTLDLRQLSRLLAQIRSLVRSRGFSPDVVTAAIVLKCWIRCLATPPRVTTHHALWSNAQQLEALWLRTRTAFLQGTFGGGTATTAIRYKYHVRPIGNMFLKAFRRLDRAEQAAQVLDWMKRCQRAEEERSLPEADQQDSASVKRARYPSEVVGMDAETPRQHRAKSSRQAARKGTM